MKLSMRHALVLTAATAAIFAAGCKAPDKTDANAPAAASTAKGAQIAGLPTEKDRVSYMVGMALGKQLEPIKDEVDFDVIAKAVKSTLKGDKLLMTDDQAREVSEAFGEKMQQKAVVKAEADAKNNLDAGKKFLADNAKKPGVQATASGLQYQVVTEGKGPKPKAGDVVRVHYKGATLDGKTFDSSYERGQPVVFPLDQVVPGWQEGIQLMPVGSKFKLWIPGNLGYGEKGTPGGPIGPNATLVFDVELLDIVQAPEQPKQ
ncbi:Peptidyl-prolyl cis-trans isomerase [Lysobacter dokdonensis DS-58]|uniref:Peptidyl-prolyl cis-trans isomerase n=1 Tax=Lysobacter dokdonensis DS-58 TaxID=1300345 RepID=A0A0A2WJH3_9GAMM|nr:FKBP-type peptidyl-prolyl cis-trans isomerase [Lysobacter dokdonensis]KGQ20326.1 Peptidyl-prolyl cis-trans isomerase [Lysobacter dokdonensis DS-58]